MASAHLSYTSQRLLLLEVLVILNVVSSADKLKPWMFTVIARRECIPHDACNLVRLMVTVMVDFVDS